MNLVQKTPLNQIHYQAGAKMVDFHGWEMPIQYEGILAEHKNTRTNASLFDVSHMGEFIIKGPDALKNLQYITTNDVAKLKIGQVQYSALLYENGTFVDDITTYRLGEEEYQLCVNASNIDKDYEWVKKHLQGNVQIENQSSITGQIAIQGPASEKILQQLTDFPLNEIKYYHCARLTIDGIPTLTARMGYTGEDGFEIFCPAENTAQIWNLLSEKGQPYNLKPAGLGARDTLRLEVCYPLCGNDIGEQYNAIESGSSWIVKFNKEDFLGKKALLKIKEQGITKKLIRFILNERGIPREGYQIFDVTGQQKIGHVTSGSSSPMLNNQGIGMGYVELEYASENTPIKISIRNKMVAAKIIKNSFVPGSTKS